jgi:prepilin-type N-terminal cleavage/methylation domain-containing protein
MTPRHDGADRGETLVEVLFALVLIGLVVGAYLAAYSTAAMG